MEQQKHTADSIMDMVKQLPIVERVRLQAMLWESIGGRRGAREIPNRTTLLWRQGLPHMRRYARSEKRETQKRHAEIHLLGL